MYYASEQIKEVLDEKSSDINSVIDDLESLATDHIDDSSLQNKITEISQELHNTSKRLASLGSSLIKDAEGTQPEDIAKKEDYPQFKTGRKLVTPLTEDETPKEVIDRLKQEEKDATDSYENAKKTKGLSKETIELLDHIKKEEIEHYLELSELKQK